MRTILLLAGLLCSGVGVAAAAAPAHVTRGAALARDLQKPLALNEETVEHHAQKAPSTSSWVPQMTVYHYICIPLAVVTLALAWLTRPKTEERIQPEFTSFQWTYLTVWYIAVAADWLQGPYVFELYMAYGFPIKQIGELFVAGFGASMLMGTFVGSLADNWGRKKTCILYCVLYIVSCCTKHFTNYWVLMFGRVTGGIATSILFSCFESWMVAEHLGRNNFSGALLGYMFSSMFFGMYAVAIASGLVAQGLVDYFPMQDFPGVPGAKIGGFLCPFDLAIVLLFICLIPMCMTWNENYGSASSESSGGSLMSAIGQCFSNWRIALVGLIVCAFEGSMYAFVFNWTPSLSGKAVPLPHGLVFAMFMMACMCGASTFSLLGKNLPAVYVICPTLILATMALGVVAFAMFGSFAWQLEATIAGFLIFEFCVGLYFPSVGTLKSEVVAENVRATVYNLFRVPLNAIVCALLLTDLPLTRAFAGCTGLLLLAVLASVPMVMSGKNKLKNSA